MFICFVILTLACVSDAYNGRIPRVLTVSGMLISQMYLVCTDSFAAGIRALLSSFAVMIILYPLFMIGAIGAGDIKLIMILPAYMRFKEVLLTLGLSFAAGAAAGLIKLIINRQLRSRLRVLAAYIRETARSGRVTVYDRPGERESVYIGDHRIHFSIPVLIGTALCTGGFIRI